MNDLDPRVELFERMYEDPAIKERLRGLIFEWYYGQNPAAKEIADLNRMWRL